MSKIDSSGLEHGRRGDKIYVVLNGQQIKKDPYCFHRATGSRAQVRPDQASPSRYLGTFRC